MATASRGAHHVGRVPRRGRGTDHGRRRGQRHGRRQRRVRVPRRLVHPLHHHGRPADERQQERQARSRTNLDSPEAVAALQNMIDLLPYSPVGGDALRLHRGARRVQRRQGRDVAGLGDHRRARSTVRTRRSRTRSPSRRCRPTTATRAASAAAGAWASPRTCPRSARTAPGTLLTYITSKDFEKYQVMTYQTDPNRISTGSDPEIVEALPYIPAAVDAIESAQILEIANIPETFEIVGLRRRADQPRARRARRTRRPPWRTRRRPRSTMLRRGWSPCRGVGRRRAIRARATRLRRGGRPDRRRPHPVHRRS